MIELRGHHILCVKGYTGWGGSPQFFDTMTHIVHELMAKPDARFILVDSVDDICKPCEWAVDGTCVHANPPKVQDDKVIKYFNLAVDKKYSYSELAKIIESKINQEIFMDICGACSEKIEICKRAWGINS